MSGRHRRPEADALPDVDLAERITPGPVVPDMTAAEPAPFAAGPTVVARRDRASQRAARRAAARRRNLVVLGAVGGVLVVVLGLFLLLRGDDEGSGTSATGPAEQQTLLLQVAGTDGVAASNALVGVTPREDSAAVVLVPSGLLVDVAGTGNLPFGETVTLPDPSAPSQALTDLVGVRVDDSWVLTSQGLAEVVDAAGGVQAAVDTDVLTTNAEGTETVVVRAGNQRLGGAAAAAYATYLGEGEPEQARLARFDDVLSGLVAELPDDRAEVVSVLEKAGDGSRTTLELQGLADRLLAMKAAAAEQSLVSDVLPVTELDTGSSVASYGIDASQAAAMMRSSFPGALQKDPGGEAVRVLVENGLGTPGLVVQARTKLVAAGFRFVNGGNASPFNDDPSRVLVPDGTEASVRRGERVAAALGLPADAVVPTDRGQTVADVIVILGSDFTP